MREGRSIFKEQIVQSVLLSSPLLFSGQITSLGSDACKRARGTTSAERCPPHQQWMRQQSLSDSETQDTPGHCDHLGEERGTSSSDSNKSLKSRCSGCTSHAVCVTRVTAAACGVLDTDVTIASHLDSLPSLERITVTGGLFVLCSEFESLEPVIKCAE